MFYKCRWWIVELLEHFSVQAQKIKMKNKNQKNPTPKKLILFFQKNSFLQFGTWNFLAPSLKNYYIFSKKNFLYLIFVIRIFFIRNILRISMPSAIKLDIYSHSSNNA